MSAHLGRRVSALVDDQLPPDERERALSHLVGCPTCQLAVDSERRAKLTLQSLLGPEPSASMLDDLFSLAGPGGRTSFPSGGASGVGVRPGTWDGSRRPRGGAPAGRPGALRVGARPVRYALAVVGVAGVSLGLAFVAGGASPVPASPSVVPAFDLMSAEHARTADRGPFAEPRAVSVVLQQRSSAAPVPALSPSSGP